MALTELALIRYQALDYWVEHFNDKQLEEELPKILLRINPARSFGISFFLLGDITFEVIVRFAATIHSSTYFEGHH